ncbi:MAG: hypothetical protein WA703_06935, partial [Pseudolabrys sp.]
FSMTATGSRPCANSPWSYDGCRDLQARRAWRFRRRKLTAQSFTIAADSLGFTWQLLTLIVKPTLDFIGTSREF